MLCTQRAASWLCKRTSRPECNKMLVHSSLKSDALANCGLEAATLLPPALQSETCEQLSWSETRSEAWHISQTVVWKLQRYCRQHCNLRLAKKLSWSETRSEAWHP